MKIRQLLRALSRFGLRPQIREMLEIGDALKAGEITEDEAFDRADVILGIDRPKL